MALLFTKDELNHAFKVWLSEYLHDNNLTYQEAANRLNMSIASIGHILNGRRKASLDLVAKSMAQAGLDYNKELRHLVPGLHLANLPETADNYEEANFLSSGDMAARGFFTVPFSSRMKLAAGGGGTIPVSEEADESSIVVHGPSIKRHSAKNLQAFRIGGDSMEPLIAEGGIVLADLAFNNAHHIKDGRIYVLCWDLDEGECACKRLTWFEKGRIISIESENQFYKPVLKRIDEIVLIGKVFWAWREFPD